MVEFYRFRAFSLTSSSLTSHGFSVFRILWTVNSMGGSGEEADFYTVPPRILVALGAGRHDFSLVRFRSLCCGFSVFIFVDVTPFFAFSYRLDAYLDRGVRGEADFQASPPGFSQNKIMTSYRYCTVRDIAFSLNCRYLLSIHDTLFPQDTSISKVRHLGFAF